MTGRSLDELGPHVAVGVDGTDAALRAVRWAAAEAGFRELPLLIVHAAPYAADVRDAHAERILARARTVARRDAPGLLVRTVCVTDAPDTALRETAGLAELLVVGAIGEGGPLDGLTDRLVNRVAGRTASPVVVVHHTVPQRGPVAVGVGDLDRDAGLVGLAHGVARRYAASLTIVHATGPEDHPDARALESLVRRWDERSTTVDVSLDYARERPIPALLARGRDARLIVVGPGGTRGHLLTGSTTHALVRGALCPVLVGGRGGAGPSTASTASGPDDADPHRRDELW